MALRAEVISAPARKEVILIQLELIYADFFAADCCALCLSSPDRRSYDQLREHTLTRRSHSYCHTRR